MDDFGMPADTSVSDFGSGDSGGSGYYSDFSDPAAGPGEISGGGLMPVQLAGIGRMLPGAGAGAAYGAGRAVGRGFGMIVAAGRRVSVKRLWEIAKRYGPEVAAGAVGFSVADLMAVFASSGVIMSSGRHRRRGISSRDIRTTKRVVGFVNRMALQIGCVHRPHFASHRARRR